MHKIGLYDQYPHHEYFLFCLSFQKVKHAFALKFTLIEDVDLVAVLLEMVIGVLEWQ